MTNFNQVPSLAYGILKKTLSESRLDEAVEEVHNLGYTIIDSDYTALELQQISTAFTKTYTWYIEKYGENKLRGADELNTIRAPLTHGEKPFLNLAMNSNLLSILTRLISGKFILNQQNAILNPPKKTYNQAFWHRDLPYQHFVSSQPLAINALFCVDDFTYENGSTFVLPVSHKSESFPSTAYIHKNALQVTAKAGSYILLDSMVFHAGGFSTTSSARRAINHLYTIPFFKQQINLPMNMKHFDLSIKEKEILGFNYIEPASISDYLITRENKLPLECS